MEKWKPLISRAVSVGIGTVIGIGAGKLLTGNPVTIPELLLLFAVPAVITLVLGIILPPPKPPRR